MNADDGAALTGLATEERLRAGDLIAELNSRARRIGLNTTDWPGLTMYRFEAPVVPQWSEVHALSLCVVAQGRKAVTIDGSTYRYDPFNYLVLRRGLRFETEILEASVEKPFLSFVLQIDPAIVRRVSADLTSPACPLTKVIEDQARKAVIGTLARELQIEWTWSPTWSPQDITPEGREQLTAIGFSFSDPDRKAS